jgi:hypothetical protein
LAQIDRTDFPILPPTTTVLEDLAEIHSWADLAARYRLGYDGKLPKTSEF